jgi:hypothetical protein
VQKRHYIFIFTQCHASAFCVSNAPGAFRRDAPRHRPCKCRSHYDARSVDKGGFCMSSRYIAEQTDGRTNVVVMSACKSVPW